MKPHRCPKCGSDPFVQLLPSFVRRFDWFGFRFKVWAVICSGCKKIVSWESDKDASHEFRRQTKIKSPIEAFKDIEEFNKIKDRKW